MRLRYCLVSLIVCAPTLMEAQAPPPSASAHTDLPVHSVTLFSSGVGFFQHAGTVHGNASSELRFTSAQIDDVLKSLTLNDLDGGHVTTVTYPSQDPIAKTLRSFDVDITSNPGMAALLNQLRGARITVDVQAEHLTGTILGVETRKKAVQGGAPVDVPTLNLLTGATIRSIELPSLSALTLDDPQLQDELTKALAALTQARDQDRKPVIINFTGTGDRRVRVGYVVETPIWKASYRLMMDGKSAHLQGWAIVENQTESDWNDVTLTLVSGRPVSFAMDLYSPLYVQRPKVALDLYQGLVPQRYDAGAAYVDGVPVKREVVTQQNALVPRDRVATALSLQPGAFEEASITTDVEGGIGPTIETRARTARLGALFQYSIPDVTLPRRKSALLPIVGDSVGIERVSIYNRSVMADHPLNGVRLRNTTGKDLMQGPVTVIDGGGYAGDAQIDDLPAGQDRLMSYGVDLDVLVTPVPQPAPQMVVSAKVNRGALMIERKTVTANAFRFDNHGRIGKAVVIEIPRMAGWRLDSGVTPLETTSDRYRFRLDVPAGASADFTAPTVDVQQQGISLLRSDTTQLVFYQQNGEISAPVRDALARAIAMRRDVALLQAEIAERDSGVSEITAEQARIRENMKTVDAKSEYYRRLLAKLNDQESTIEQLQKERGDLVTRRDAQQKALEDYLDGLNVG